METPVIRSQVRQALPVNRGHYAVYLPAYSDKRIIRILSKAEGINWEVFSKHSGEEYTEKNVHIRPVENEEFIKSLVSCTGILCGAGFETPAEALFLKKKLMVIPMKGQYEQQCNAAALQSMGVPVIKSLRKKHLDKIRNWTVEEQHIAVDFPDHTERLIDTILRDHSNTETITVRSGIANDLSTKSFKQTMLNLVFNQKMVR
jgi:uncharacterized protein (TIGR00661 family)